MGKLHPHIDDRLRAFIAAQHIFFVATAPEGTDGHVNCSPKGRDSFRVLGPNSVAYLDYVGSGVETIAHTQQNGRIVLMFCAFDGPPNIVRLHGRASVFEPGDPGFAAEAEHFPGAGELGVRAVVHVEVTRIAESCGFGVPLYRYEGERPQMPAWAEKKGHDGLADYQRRTNAASIDGLAALRWVANPHG
jgi:hypothetical protein